MYNETNGALHWKAPTFIFLLVSCIVLAVRFTYYGLGFHSPAAEMAISVVLQDVLFILCILYYMKFDVKLPLSAINWRPIDLPTVGKSILLGICFVVAMNGLMLLLSTLMPRKIPPQDIEKIFSLGDPWMTFFVSLLVMAVVAPIAEEFFFRGLLFHAILPNLGERGAMLVTGLCFGLAHGDIYRFLPLAMAGYVFQLIAQKAGTIKASMIAHGVWNGLTVIYAFLFTF